MTTLALIRHGITEWNEINKLQGHQNIPLSEKGKEQVLALANRLVGEKWDIIYSSDLQRAKETANILAEKMGLQVMIDKRLRERYFGRLEGTIEIDRMAQWGKYWRELHHGIEENEKIELRVAQFFYDIIHPLNEKKIIVISHGITINKMLKIILKDYNEIEIHNTSVSILKKNDHEWFLHLFNCTEHLKKMM
ncbi:histidine phosphatase family protein [Bacillus aquiflavi]|uniref:Histidine phosphatase family protein n=1 Tax=Bacillus aquiflavi TaxID=2672567 RepID=A0A6B3VXC1_9BACI|nr:histidine phosphatase family protein [Bacillus aquiflavi]MBA4535618.1 histidine phosphatase family protein [Bacillus aquiflavi]NEY79994.1 histidine phosphatase family protein [Bacillus aquiflavi]UAC48934.1 histidine phosphatase family protein [Bacillus aquiflavi]